MIERTLIKMLAPLRSQIALLLTRGAVKLTKADKGMQTVQLSALYGELLNNVEYFEQYGHTSRPKAGAEAVVGNIGGKRSHAIALLIGDRRYRLTTLKEGEVALYDDLGNVVHLMRDRVKVNAVTHLEVAAPTAEITATTTHIGNVTINGGLTVNGPITGTGGMAISGGAGATIDGDMQISNGDVTADGISLKTHKHGGVQFGTDVSGGPQ